MVGSLAHVKDLRKVTSLILHGNEGAINNKSTHRLIMTVEITQFRLLTELETIRSSHTD